MRVALLLASAIALLSTASAQTGCVELTEAQRESQMPTCKDVVTYAIPDDLDVTAADTAAGSVSVPLPNCMYYGLPTYACQLQFPRCTADATPRETLMCKSVCEAGLTWSNDGFFCAQTAYDPDCGNTSKFFNGTSPACTYFEIREPSNATPAAWKWALVGIAAAVGLAIILFLLVQCYRRSRVSPVLTDADIDRPFEHEVARRKRQEQRAAEEAKQRDKEAKKAAKANGGKPPANGGADGSDSVSQSPNHRAARHGHTAEPADDGVEMQAPRAV